MKKKTRIKFRAVGIRDNNRRTPIAPWRASFPEAKSDADSDQDDYYPTKEIMVAEWEEDDKLFHGVVVSLEGLGAQ